MSTNATPAYSMAAICGVGGIIGYARTRSIPSIVAGLSVGALYLWSADNLSRGAPNGLEGAVAASALLLLSSLPRVTAGPVPALLTVTSALAGGFYGNKLYALKK